MTLDIQKLKAKFKKIEPKLVTDKEVVYVLANLARNISKPVSVDRAAKKGDFVLVSYVASNANGVEKMSDSNMGFFLGANEVLPGLEVIILGISPGEKKSADLKIPEDYQVEDLRGEVLTFDVKLLQVHEVDVLAIEDSLAATILGEGKTVNDLKLVLRDELKLVRINEAKKMMELQLIELVISNVDVEVSEEKIEQELVFMYESACEVAEQKGMDKKAYDDLLVEKGDDYKKLLREHAKKNLILDLVLAELSSNGTLIVGDEEAEEAILLSDSPVSDENRVQIKSELKKSPQLLVQMKKRLLLEKLLDVVIS